MLNVSSIGKVVVTEGDDVVLTCNVTRSDGKLLPPCSGDVQIEWLVNGSTISSCSAGSLDNYSRELKFNPDSGSLTIHDTQTTDAAIFICGVNAHTDGYEHSTTELVVQRGKL